MQDKVLPTTADKRITLVFGKMNIVSHEESFILAEKTLSAGIANSLTGDTLAVILNQSGEFKNLTQH